MIPYSQALRLRRIFSEDRQFGDRWKELAGWLGDRGFENSLVKEQLEKARRQDRQTLLNNSGKKSSGEEGVRVPFVTTYHPALSLIGKVVGRLHSMLKLRKSVERFFLHHHLYHLDDVRI